ncbi:MAG: hypothetical protein M0Z56_01655, partial [Desulfobacteraceae bacterium]|nr:hypothetical protein [Desulfobacteraceae bacterium]
MKRYRIMASFILSLLFVCSSNSFGAWIRSDEPVFKSASVQYNVSWRDDIRIKAYDGVSLAANIFVPKTSNPNARFPVIIMPNSWLCEEHEYTAQASLFCQKGYIVLGYSTRGWGISTGLVNVGGPDDMKDIQTIITWLIANYPVEGAVKNSAGKVIDDSKAMIGMCGISYGGGLSLLGAAHDQRIKAVMCMVPWGDLGCSLYMNQTPKEVWHKMILFEGGNIIGNLDPSIGELTTMIFNQDTSKYDYIINWAIDRSPIAYLDELNYTNDGKQRDIAICISSNLQDELFTPNATLDFFYGLKTPKKRMDINRGIHASAEATGLLGFDNVVWRKAHAWMDENLKHVDTGIMTLKKMSICDKSNGDRYYTDHIYIKDLNINYIDGLYDTTDNVNTLTPEKFYLGNRADGKVYGKLGATPLSSTRTNTIQTGSASGITTGIPVISSLLEAHTNWLHVLTWFPLTSKKKAIVFASDAVTKDRLIMGTPHLKLNVTPTTSSYQLIAHLYTLDAYGTGTLIT